MVKRLEYSRVGDDKELWRFSCSKRWGFLGTRDNMYFMGYLEFTLSSEDKIIIIASDGVWEFLENEDIVTKLAPFYEKNEIEQACDFLLDYANSSWTSNSPAIDDISFVMIFMGYTS